MNFLFIGCRFNDQLLRMYARKISKRSPNGNYPICEPKVLSMNGHRFLVEQGPCACDPDVSRDRDPARRLAGSVDGPNAVRVPMRELFAFRARTGALISLSGRLRPSHFQHFKRRAESLPHGKSQLRH